MRQVFTGKQVTHVWASQSQDSARNSCNSVFFQGPTIYSYGLHFPMARIYNGFALVNSERYSSTTAKHLSWVRQALRGRMLTIEVPMPTDALHPDNESHLLDAIGIHLDAILNPRKALHSREAIYTCIKTLNDYYGFTGQRKRFALDTLTTEIVDGLMGEKIEVSAAKDLKKHLAEALRRFKEAEKYKTEIALWDSHGNTAPIPSHLFPFDMVRKHASRDMIETSQGAEVPLLVAAPYLTCIAKGLPTIGQRLGSFTIESEPCADGYVKIGCHRININQARKALGL